jgi:hypothetical protein
MPASLIAGMSTLVSRAGSGASQGGIAAAGGSYGLPMGGVPVPGPSGAGASTRNPPITGSPSRTPGAAPAARPTAARPAAGASGSPAGGSA